MSREKLLIKLVKPKAIVPCKNHDDDACYDVYACLDEPVEIPAFGRSKVPLGFAMQLPNASYQAKILGRSGLNTDAKIVPTGTVDYGYRGEVMATLINITNEPFTVEHGMRIAQLDIQKVYDFEICITDTLDNTERGTKGFGSSGLM